jgi:uncharacterized YccA/Bax inhibitor family protein
MDNSAAIILALVFLVCVTSSVILVWITVFKKTWSPFTAPVYALLQGLVVGTVTVGTDRRYPGIAIHAIGLTIAICVVLLGAYHSGLIRVTESFRKKLVVATGGVTLYYLAGFVLTINGGHTLNTVTGGFFGIFISLIIVTIAVMNLASNFDFAVLCATKDFPKYMEWYAALGLLLTLAWLYLETLRLLSKADQEKS